MHWFILHTAYNHPTHIKNQKKYSEAIDATNIHHNHHSQRSITNQAFLSFLHIAHGIKKYFFFYTFLKTML